MLASNPDVLCILAFFIFFTGNSRVKKISTLYRSKEERQRKVYTISSISTAIIAN